MPSKRRDEPTSGLLRWVLFGGLAAALGAAVISTVAIRRDDRLSSSEVPPTDETPAPTVEIQARRNNSRPAPPSFQAASETNRPSDVTVSEEVRSRLVANTQQELRKLEMQQPENFLKAVVSRDKDPELARAVYEKAGRYFAARTAALRSMMLAHVNSFGDYDHRQDLARLDEIDAAFKQDVAELKTKLPKLEQLADIMAKTALPVPTFARVDDRFRMSAAALAATSAGPSDPRPSAAPSPAHEQLSPAESRTQTPSNLEDPQ